MLLQAKQMHKMTTISLKIVEVVILSENSCHFVSCSAFKNSFFFWAWDKSRAKWDNSQKDAEDPSHLTIGRHINMWLWQGNKTESLLFWHTVLSMSDLGPLHVLWQVSFGCWVTWSISSWQKYYKSVFFNIWMMGNKTSLSIF